MKAKELIELLKPYEEYYVIRSILDHESDNNIYIAPSLTYKYFTGIKVEEGNHNPLQLYSVKIIMEDTKQSHYGYNSHSVSIIDINNTLTDYWIGPYKMLVPNSIDSVVAKDGRNIRYKNGSETELGVLTSITKRNIWLLMQLNQGKNIIIKKFNPFRLIQFMNQK